MKELLTTYPKATEVVKAYYLQKLIESLKADLPEEFKEHVRQQGIDDEKIAKIIQESPRMLFDVFDEHKFHIQISGTDKSGWTWEVLPNYEFSRCTTRKNAEVEAIKLAFKLLNDKL